MKKNAAVEWLADALQREDISEDERLALVVRMVQCCRLELESQTTQAWVIAGYTGRSFGWALALLRSARGRTVAG